ncbi:Glycoside hydrolase, family 4 like protein, partial [Aduncisulcus paluster]
MGLCNVPIGMTKNVAKMLNVPSERLFIEFAGLNHLVWGKRIWLDGERIDDKVFDLIADGESMTMKNIPDLKWDGTFLKTLGMLPCPYHRYYYLTKDMLEDEIEASKDGKTRAEA